MTPLGLSGQIFQALSSRGGEGAGEGLATSFSLRKVGEEAMLRRGPLFV